MTTIFSGDTGLDSAALPIARGRARRLILRQAELGPPSDYLGKCVEGNNGVGIANAFQFLDPRCHVPANVIAVC